MSEYKRLVYASPQTTKRSSSIKKDDEIVLLINSLNVSIKSYYNSTKLSLSQVKSSLPVNQQPKIEALDSSLISFIKDAKRIFKELKDVHSKSKRDFEPLNSNFISSRVPSHKKSINPLSPLKYLTTLVSSPFSDKVNVFSESNQRYTHQTTKHNNNTCPNSDNYHQVLALAHEVISFLTNLIEFEDCIMKKSSDLKLKKKQFEIIKNRLLELAQGILDSSRRYYVSSQDSKKSSNGNSTSKDKEEGKKPKKSKEDVIYLNNSIKTKTNGSSSLSPKRSGNEIQLLQKENKELLQKVNELNEMLAANSSTTLIDKLKGYEAEVKKLKEINIKASIDKSKSTDDKLRLKDTKIRSLTSTIKEYSQLIDQKEKVILVLKNDIKKITSMTQAKETEFRRKMTNKKNEISLYKERLRSDSNGIVLSGNNYSPSYSQIADESNEKLSKRIQELTNEIIGKNKELEKLKEEDAQKDMEISYCARELTEIKELFETENTNLKEDLKNMTKDNKLLTGELKLLNDQINKMNKVIKPGCQSPSDHSHVILAKNTIEYKKIHDELFKERKEKIELLNTKKLLKEELMKITNELLERNKEVEILSQEVITLDERLRQMNYKQPTDPDANVLNTNSIDPNTAISPSQLVNNYINDACSNQKGMTTVGQIDTSPQSKDKILKLQAENHSLKQTIDLLNEQQIGKETLITQLKALESLIEDKTQVIAKKTEEISGLNKKVKQQNESYEILKTLIREKDSSIIDLNNKVIKIGISEKALKVDKEKLIEFYESKLKDLNKPEMKEEDIKSSNVYIQSQNELKTLQSIYNIKCTLITNKNKQIDAISTQNETNEKEILTLKSIIKANEEKKANLHMSISFQEIVFLIELKPKVAQAAISYDKYKIICDKSYNSLYWYLITPNDSNSNEESYSNTYWIETTRIEPDRLVHFNKFKTEKETNEEALMQLNAIQAQLMKKIEEKDSEVMRLQQENKQLTSKAVNTNLSGEMNPLSPRKEFNENDFIPIEKYRQVIIELNDLNTKLNKSNAFVTKLKNENKELSKVQDEGKASSKAEQAISFINTENKDNQFFFDDELKDVINIPECRPGQGIEGCFNELKTLVQILIHEMTYTSKIKKILNEICKLIGFSEEDTAKMISEKEKKGGILNIFKKK